MTENANVISANLREGVGKERAKKLRVQGLVPAIYYHQGEEAIPLTLDKVEFNRIIRSGNQIIDLDLGSKKKKVLIRDMQFHPVTEDILHVDFQGVSMSEEISVSVPLKFTGSAIGVKEGGILESLMHELEIRCKVSDIPHELEVDVTDVTKGNGIHVRDLSFKGLEILASPDAAVVMVTAPSGTDIPEDDAEGEEEEGTEEESSEEEGEE